MTTDAISLDRFLETYYRRRPVNATFTGMHDYDAELPDWTPEGLAHSVDEMREFRERLGPHRPSPGMLPPSAVNEIDVELADAFCEIQVAERTGTHFQRGNPALYTGEAIFGAVSLMIRDFAPATDRANALEARFRAIPQLLAAATRTIDGAATPALWRDRAVRECVAAERLFGDGLIRWMGDAELAPTHTERLAEAATGALGGFAVFRRWLAERPEAPAGAARCGDAMYDLLLRRGHWCTQSRSALLAEARDRFAETRARMDTVGWSRVAAQLNRLRPSPDAYLETYQRTWDACQAHAERHDLLTWPDFPLRYIEMPEWARDTAPELYFLHYRSPAPLDAVSPVDYLVPALRRGVADPLPAGVNDSVIKLNHVVHHGALGHHVQNYRAYRARSRIGRIAAVDTANRIGMFAGGSLAEGWACYATDLADETGFLTDAEQLAAEHSRLRQLARAIVDIEIHQGTMTEPDGMRFLCEQVEMSEGAARQEITRTTMFPGTAVMYWLGTQGIHDLRAHWQRALGAAFSLRSFHDTLLGYGAIPVLLISQLMTMANDAHDS